VDRSRATSRIATKNRGTSTTDNNPTASANIRDCHRLTRSDVVTAHPFGSKNPTINPNANSTTRPNTSASVCHCSPSVIAKRDEVTADLNKNIGRTTFRRGHGFRVRLRSSFGGNMRFHHRYGRLESLPPTPTLAAEEHRTGNQCSEHREPHPNAHNDHASWPARRSGRRSPRHSTTCSTNALSLAASTG